MKFFVNAKNNMKQRNLNTVFATISKTTWPTSDSFLLIMSHNILCAEYHTLLDVVIMCLCKTLYC